MKSNSANIDAESEVGRSFWKIGVTLNLISYPFSVNCAFLVNAQETQVLVKCNVDYVFGVVFGYKVTYYINTGNLFLTYPFSKDTQVNKLASSMVAEEHVSKWSKVC